MKKLSLIVFLALLLPSLLWAQGLGIYQPGGGSSSGDATTLQGRALAATAPANLETICWDAVGVTWKPCAPGTVALDDVANPDAAKTFTLIDDNASALSFGATGAADLLKIETTNTGPGVTIGGYLSTPATMTSLATVTWTLIDNQNAALAIRADGANDILKITTLDIGPGVTVTGYLTTTGQLLSPDGTAGTPSISFATEPTSGWFHPAGGVTSLSISASERLRFSAVTGGGLLETLDPSGIGGYASSAVIGSPDVFLVREGAAIWQIGLDAAGVTNQTFKAADRITSDGVGANLTIAAGRNRGASAGGSLIFQTSPAAAPGAAGVLATALTIASTGIANFASYPTVGGAAVFDQDVSADANPSFSTLNLVATNSLNLGTASSATGQIVLKNATNANTFTVSSGVSGAALSWTTPTAAPGGANYLLNVDADGTMGYTDPAGFQAADTDLTTYAGITPSANAQTLLGETFAQMQGSLSIDDLITLSGVAEGSANLGTFTGTTIADSVTIKAALQALETSLELKATLASPTFTGSVILPSANADPAATAGSLVHDSTVTNFANGALRYYNGAAIKQLIDMTAATAEACTDDQVVAYDADNDLWYCKTDASGGSTAYDDIGDPDASGSIGFGVYTGTYTSATSGWGGIIISDTVASVDAATTLLSLKFTGDATPNADHIYLLMENYGGNDHYLFTGTQASFYNPLVSYVQNVAGAGADAITISQTLNAMDGAGDYYRGLYVTLTNANHSAGNVYGIDLQLNAGDADATERGINISANWDYGIYSASPISGTVLHSTVATGTAPLTVASTTEVTNLHAATATALAADPTDCAAGSLATGIAANGNAACTAEPSVTSIYLGIESNTVGTVVFHNATNNNHFSIKSGVSGAAIEWTLPTTVSGGANYLLNVDTDGTMGYTDPSTLGGAVATDAIWDAAGDLVQGTGANTAAKLTKGAEGTILRAGAASVAWTTSTFADTYAIGTLLHASAANVVAGLGAGTTGQILTGVTGAAPAWSATPTVTSISTGTTGVSLSGANGILTILGQGDGADESLLIDFNTTANSIIFTSGTAADILNMNAFTISSNGLVPDAAGGAALGTGALPFSSVYIGDAATNNVQLINTAAASAVVLTLPSTTGTLARLEDKIADLAASTSAELAAKISDEQGTGVIVFSDSPTFVDDINLGAAGVKLTGANGSLTILGLGDGQDEDVKIDLNTTANTIIISSPASSATKVSLSALNLATTGIITGAIGVTTSAGSYTLGTIAEEVNGYLILFTAAGTLTLPDMTIGQFFCAMSRDDNEVVTIDAHANDSITICPTAATCVKGVAGATVVNTVSASDGAANYICFIVVEADNIMQIGARGTWVVP